MSLSRRTGTLQLTSVGGSGEILFERGLVVASSRPDGVDSVGDRLMSANVVAPTVYQEMLAVQAQGVTGRALLERFDLIGPSLQEALAEAVKTDVYRMLTWDEGGFSFVLAGSVDRWFDFSLDGRRMVALEGLDPQGLTREGARLRSETSRGDSLDEFLANTTEGTPATGRESGSSAGAQKFTRDLESASATVGDASPSIEATSADAVPPLASPEDVTTLPPVSSSRFAPYADAEQPAAAATASNAAVPPPSSVVPPPSSAVPPPASAVPPPSSVVPPPSSVVPPPSSVVPPPSSTVPPPSSVVPPPGEAKPKSAGLPPKELPPPSTATLHGPSPQETPGSSAATNDDQVIPFPASRVRRSADGEGTPITDSNSSLALDPRIEPSADVEAGGRVLLVVDDDLQVCTLISTVLSDNFTRVLTAASTAEAIACVREHWQHLVLALDLIIARSDGGGILGGIEVLEAARALSQTMPVLLFTDYQNVEAEERGRSLGVIDVLRKPRKAELYADIDQHDLSAATGEFLDTLCTALEPHFGTGSVAGLGAAEETSGVQAEGLQPESADDLIIAEEKQPGGSFDPQDLIAGVDVAGSPAADLPPTGPRDNALDNLASMLAELAQPASRGTLSLMALRFAASVVERAALFVVKADTYLGLGGFAPGEASDKYVRRILSIQIDLGTESILARTHALGATVRGKLADNAANRDLLDRLAGSSQASSTWHGGEVVAVPLVSEGRVEAIVFGDNPSGEPLRSTYALEIFMQQAGLTLDRTVLEHQLEEARQTTRER